MTVGQPDAAYQSCHAKRRDERCDLQLHDNQAVEEAHSGADQDREDNRDGG